MKPACRNQVFTSQPGYNSSLIIVSSEQPSRVSQAGKRRTFLYMSKPGGQTSQLADFPAACPLKPLPFLCIPSSFVHQSLRLLVLSLYSNILNDHLSQLMIRIGNDKANLLLEHKLPEDDKITPESDV